MQDRLFRHRQPKGSATAMVGLNITAPLLDSTKWELACGGQRDVGPNGAKQRIAEAMGTAIYTAFSNPAAPALVIPCVLAVSVRNGKDRRRARCRVELDAEGAVSRTKRSAALE